MPEIRRVKVPEAVAVAELWDRMCRQTPDGGPLTEAGRGNIQRMVEVSAWHRDTFCLVAVEGDQLLGFVMGRVDAGDGLLPSLLGQVEEVYVPAELAGDGALARQLVEAAVAMLRQRNDLWTIRHLTSADGPRDRELFTGLGFEADMICPSLYAEGPHEC